LSQSTRLTDGQTDGPHLHSMQRGKNVDVKTFKKNYFNVKNVKKTWINTLSAMPLTHTPGMR